jgi:osmotically-inducible protein OsmY
MGLAISSFNNNEQGVSKERRFQMSTRHDDRDRDYDRDAQYYGQYGRRSDTDYGRGNSSRSESGRDWDSERYGNEGRFIGDEPTSRYSSGRGRNSQSGRENYWGRGWENERDESNRESRYGSYGRSGAERGYSEGLNQGYPQRYNYPTGFRSNERYSERERGRDYGSDYDRDQGRGRYDRESYGRGEDRGWWDRASDAVASWFGDEDAERRRRMDDQREHRGRGPKGYRRSDERIREDVNDRLSDDYYLDASEVEVAVSNTEVTLTGTVNNRSDKRRAEDLADSVSGVSNVENRLRVKQSGYGDYGRTSTSSGSSTGTGTGTQIPTGSNITGTPGTTASSAAAGGRTSNT